MKTTSKTALLLIGTALFCGAQTLLVDNLSVSDGGSFGGTNNAFNATTLTNALSFDSTNASITFNSVRQIYWTGTVLQMPGFDSVGNVEVEGGTFRLSGASTFLQMKAANNTTGYQFYDWYNGADKLQLRRKTDDGASVLEFTLSISNDVVAFAQPPVGDGSGLTNLNGGSVTGVVAQATYATAALNSTNFWGLLDATNLPTAYVAPEATHATNADFATTASYATNDLAGDTIAMATKAASTNASIVDSLAVTGVTGDGIRLAVRKAAGQTNNVFEVQDESNVMLFGVRSNGVAWGDGGGLTNLAAASISHAVGAGYTGDVAVAAPDSKTNLLQFSYGIVTNVVLNY